MTTLPRRRRAHALLFLVLTLGLCHSAAALQLSTELGQDRITTGESRASATVATGPGRMLGLSEGLSADEESQRVVSAAMDLIGTRYHYGEDSDNAVDCSAMVRRAFESIGLQLPRSSLEMLSSGHSVDTQELLAGDVLIYRFGRHQLHATLYLGNDTIVHASPEAGRVIVTHLDASWRKRLVAARRVL